jgi:hypothetical protein
VDSNVDGVGGVAGKSKLQTSSSAMPDAGALPLHKMRLLEPGTMRPLIQPGMILISHPMNVYRTWGRSAIVLYATQPENTSTAAQDTTNSGMWFTTTKQQ